MSEKLPQLDVCAVIEGVTEVPLRARGKTRSFTAARQFATVRGHERLATA